MTRETKDGRWVQALVSAIVVLVVVNVLLFAIVNPHTMRAIAVTNVAATIAAAAAAIVVFRRR